PGAPVVVAALGPGGVDGLGGLGRGPPAPPARGGAGVPDVADGLGVTAAGVGAQGGARALVAGPEDLAAAPGAGGGPAGGRPPRLGPKAGRPAVVSYLMLRTRRQLHGLPLAIRVVAQ